MLITLAPLFEVQRCRWNQEAQTTWEKKARFKLVRKSHALSQDHTRKIGICFCRAICLFCLFSLGVGTSGHIDVLEWI